MVKEKMVLNGELLTGEFLTALFDENLNLEDAKKRLKEVQSMTSKERIERLYSIEKELMIIKHEQLCTRVDRLTVETNALYKEVMGIRANV